jgi:hypothetical protein
MPSKLVPSKRGWLDGGPDQLRGESTPNFNNRRHRNYVESFVALKKAAGEWLPKEEYEAKTGKTGRK